VNPAAYQIFTAPLGGGPPVTVDPSIANATTASLVADTEGFVYWANAAANGKIRRANTASNPTTPLDVVVGAVYPAYPADGLTVDDTYVYFIDNSYDLWRAKKDGSEAAQRLLRRGSSPVYMNSILGSDTQFLYGSGNGGQIVRVRKTPAGG
jgi:hypothetical protein